MSLRDTMNKRPALSTAIVVVVLAAAGLLVYWQLTTAGRPTGLAAGEWFYDLETNKLFPGPTDSVPPIEAPSKGRDPQGQPTGVRAYVFSCADCDTKNQFIGYLETFTAEARKAKEDLAKLPAALEGGLDGANPEAERVLDLQDVVANGLRIASPEAPTVWLEPISDEARALVDAANRKCGERVLPTRCYP